MIRQDLCKQNCGLVMTLLGVVRLCYYVLSLKSGDNNLCTCAKEDKTEHDIRRAGNSIVIALQCSAL